MKKTIPVLLLSAAAMFAACTRDVNQGEGAESYDPSRPVSFITTNEPDTRGTPVDNVSQLTTMGVFCSFTGADDWSATAAPGKMFNERLNNDAGKWSYEGSDVFWGATDLTHRYSFFAYAPYTTADNGIVVNGSVSTAGIPTLTYTVPTDVTKQPDLMVAVPRYNIRPTGSAVALQMRHALTCVGFQIAGNGEKVTGISITGVSMTGTLAMNGNTITWSSPGAVNTATDFSASINKDSGKDYYTATGTMSTDLIAGNGYLMMIPQTLTSAAKIIVTLDDGTTREISLDTQQWIAGQKVIYQITLVPGGTVTVTPSTLLLPWQGVNHTTDNIEVICEDNQGAPAPDLPWTLTSSDPWLTLTKNSDGTDAAASVSGTGSATVYTIATENTLTTNRTTTIYMGSQSANTVVTATQLKKVDQSTITGGGTLPTGKTSYVGAFWRAGQTGERIIRISVGTDAGNHGDWSAWVAWTDGRWSTGDIVLDTDNLSDEKLLERKISFTDASYNNPDDAELYKLTGNASIVGGTVASGGTIAFRIGLKSAFTSANGYSATPDYTTTYPARYAVIVLSYNNYGKHQKILLRQGEDADCIGGTQGNGGTKWAVYNVGNYAVPAQYGGDAGFVAYPSQAGYFKMFNTQTAMFSPIESSNIGSTTAATITNVCPTGYKIPNSDGSPSTNTTGNYWSSANEMGGLLHTGTSSVWGYYADGFFDRRKIDRNPTADGTTVNAVAVSNSDNTVAYLGRLFFNTTTNASIFLPAAGNRNGSSLTGTGYGGFYWSSSPYSSSSYYLTFTSGTVYQYNYPRGNGFTIRCVSQ